MQWGVIALVLSYITSCWAIAQQYDSLDRFTLLIYSEGLMTFSVWLFLFFLCAVSIRIMLVDRPQRLGKAIVRELTEVWFTRQRIEQGAPLLLAFLLFISCFSSMKSMIPVLNPYAWDTALSDWDLALHGGLAPWRLTHSVFGAAMPTYIINFLYNLWLPVMLCVLYWQMFTQRDHLVRTRFLLSFFLCWIINGTILATIFSSVGPCFFGLQFPWKEDPYGPLIQTLQTFDAQFPVWALSTQEMLWGIYQRNTLGFGSGISAMPSMHVSIAFLMFLLGREKHAFWKHAFGTFCGAIVLGSIHLGWHYAIDGYVALLTTYAIWRVVGRGLKPAVPVTSHSL